MFAEVTKGMEKYVGLVPWEGIGSPIVQECTAAEAIKLGGLDWDVETARIITNDQKKTAIERYRVTRRVSDNSILGIVKANWVPIQNRDAFKLFDSVVGKKAAKYYNVGEIDGGSQVFIIAKLPEPMLIGKGLGGEVDEVDRYLVLSNWHDGQKPLQMVFSPVRVVCQNTLAMALSGRFFTTKEGKVDKTKFAPRIRISHNDKADMMLKESERIMAAAFEYYEKFGEFANHLYKRPILTNQLNNIVATVFPPNKKMEVTPTIAGHRHEVTRLFEEGKGHDKIFGTAWALMNAFAEYADHDYSFRKKEDPGQRAKSIWMGGAQGLKTRANKVIMTAVAT